MLLELVKKNRSYRGFDHDYKFTQEQLSYFVDCARNSASSVNLQPLKYYLAWKDEEVATIQALTAWAKGLPDVQLPHEGKEPTAFIIILQDTTISKSTTSILKDTGIAAQTMLLAASEQGLGGCMIGNFNPAKVSDALGLEEHLIPLLLIALGKPDETVVLVDIDAGESTKYYRDANDVHYVPKRKLKDIVLTSESEYDE